MIEMGGSMFTEKQGINPQFRKILKYFYEQWLQSKHKIGHDGKDI
jgi:hypothetical protein